MIRTRTGLTAVPGILAAGVHAGIKRNHESDLALIVSERMATAAGTFTTNRCPAAPVVVTRHHLRRGKISAIIVNSGNANACTGPRGYSDALEMAHMTAGALNLDPHTVCVGSTGMIGAPLPLERIRKAIPLLTGRLRPNGGREAAQAIMTTDTRPKEAAATAKIGGHRITIGGIAKGSGMIHPNMATTLAFLATDAAVERRALKYALRTAVNGSFNTITIDGDTSTNDMVLCLANGVAENRPIITGSPTHAIFQRLLQEVCLDLAKQICRDGEGVTKLIEVVVQRARRHHEAMKIATAVGTSLLFKAAMFGQDPNWGRIMAAIGRANVPIKPDRIALSFGGIMVVKNGMSTGHPFHRASKTVLRKREFRLTIDLGMGREHGRIFTTDLSPAYVEINGQYHT